MKRYILLLLVILQVVVANAKKGKGYDTKSMIVGLTTTDLFYSGHCSGKCFDNDIATTIPVILSGNKIDAEDTRRELEAANFGKKVLDLLFMRSSGQLSEELLQKRAWQNAQIADRERAQVGVFSPDQILKDDILPILESNYIVVTHDIYKKKKNGDDKLIAKSWAVYHVDIDKNTWDAVLQAWNDMNAYDAIPVHLSLMASGKCKPSKLMSRISKKVPALAVRGPIVSRSPYEALLEDADVPSGERMKIYTLKQNSKGENVASYIGKARVKGDVDENTRLFPIAGLKGNPKRGDFAVLSPASHTAHTVLWQHQSYSDALRYDLERRVVDVGSFFCSIDTDVRAGKLKDHKTALYPVGENLDGMLRSPVFTSIGIGSSYGWMPVKGVGLEIYWLLQGEVWLSKYHTVPSTAKNPDDSLWGSFDLRMPLGMKASVNLWYPVRLIGGFEWGPMLIAPSDISKNVLGARKWKRGELSWFVGLRFAY